MRTTLIISDEILAEAKRRAAERKSNVSAIVNEALTKAFHSAGPPSSSTSFQILTYHPQNSRQRRTTPSEMYDLLVAEELAPYQK